MITRKQLSTEQESALKHMLTFVKSSEQQMVLSGYAGTGKTSLINVFLREISNSHEYLNCYCTAPTNEAVRVISNATGNKYEMTIYSLLGLALVEENGQRPKIIQKNKPKINEYDLIILDEASMIGDELLSKINDQLKKTPYLKMIYVGDSAQLPPITTNDDQNKEQKLFVEQTESNIFKISNIVELTEVQRVAKNNPIINVVTPIRMNLSSKQDCFTRDNYYHEGSGVEFYNNASEYLELMMNDFTSEEYTKNSNYVRVIAYTNNAVNKLNIKIRKRIFKTDTPDEYLVGEVLIVGSPVFKRINKNVKESVMNIGERIRIVEAELDVEDTGMKVWRLIAKKFDESDKENYELLVISKDSQEAYFSILQSLAIKAKEKLSMKNSKGKPLYNGGEAWSEYYAFKDNYCRLKYSYAMTTHTSQGSTVERIYVIERDLNILSWNDIIRNKLKYTAFTRASKLLRILT